MFSKDYTVSFSMRLIWQHCNYFYIFCCVFWPVYRCFACRSLVKINFFKILNIFFYHKQKKEKAREKGKKYMKKGVYWCVGATPKCWYTIRCSTIGENYYFTFYTKSKNLGKIRYKVYLKVSHGESVTYIDGSRAIVV